MGTKTISVGAEVSEGMILVKKGSPNMGTKILSFCPISVGLNDSEKRIPKHGDENTSPLSVYVVNTWLT